MDPIGAQTFVSALRFQGVIESGEVGRDSAETSPPRSELWNEPVRFANHATQDFLARSARRAAQETLAPPPRNRDAPLLLHPNFGRVFLGL
ncbi:MAG: hypothetical protein M2R45_05085 [Verrucomicrobia subdivision 3 bacterium]|nr:hypothetical protein [Limisphaerales bacterium]MCS1417162.1 hypothetical protein [Limisphaerales bacterium]